MLISTLGHIRDNLYILGNLGYPMYLLDAPKPVLFEGGICCAGNIYVNAIRSILGNRQPSALFLTHAHWDHCGAVSYLKDMFPALKVAASDRAVETLKRPNALALIQRLNEEARIAIKSFPGYDSSQVIDDPFRPFEVDIELKDNHIMDLGEGTTVEILATPGHTRDHHSYYLRKGKILIAGEAAGLLLNTGTVTTEFLSSYDAYMSSLERLAALPVEVICQGHGVVLVGKEEINEFFKRSISETIRFKDRIFELLDKEGGSLDRVVQRVKAERYDIIPSPKQPETPYLINLKAQVAHLAAKKA